MGAYGLAVAAAFAVALAVLVSVSTTSTVEAADVPLTVTPNSTATAAPGDTVQIAVAGALAQVSITGTGEGVGASFAANDGQSISCADDTSCDENSTPNEIQVDLNVDADSGEGYILVSVNGIGGTSPTEQETKVITVSKGSLLGSLKAETSSKTIAANDDNSTAGDGGPNEAQILATVKNASTPSAGLDLQRVTFITTLGTLACPDSTAPPGGTNITAVSGVQVCSVWTSAQDNPLTTASDSGPGFAVVRLDGAGREGVATVTVTVGGLTETLDVTMYGTAKNLAAAPMQDSVEIGGSVYVVLTVTDAAGNPVSGQPIAPVTSPAKEVEGPADDAVLVETEQDTPPADTTNDTAGIGYSKDFIHPSDATKNIPACGDDNVGSQSLPASTEGFTDDGTNADGQCVVHVTAPKKGVAGAAENATRGAHTLNFQVSSSIKASAVIEVAGSPSSITTDAPDRVDPESLTEITRLGVDDEDVLVGVTDVKVRKIGGDGLIEDQGDATRDDTEATSNGQSAFTFIAPRKPGSAEILISAGDVDHRVTIQIGEAMEEPEEPAVPEGDATLSVVGNLGVFSGGSAADLAAAAEAACPGGWSIAAQDAEGVWKLWSNSAPAFVNDLSSAAFPDGFGASTPVWITSCEADALENEG